MRVPLLACSIASSFYFLKPQRWDHLVLETLVKTFHRSETKRRHWPQLEVQGSKYLNCKECHSLPQWRFSDPCENQECVPNDFLSLAVGSQRLSPYILPHQAPRFYPVLAVSCSQGISPIGYLDDLLSREQLVLIFPNMVMCIVQRFKKNSI